MSWIDADEESGWQSYGKTPAWLIITVGYLVDIPIKSTEFFVLANSHLPETGEWSGISRIPKGMVVDIKKIKKSMPCGRSLDEDFGDTGHSD